MQATPTLWQALVTDYPEKLQGLNILVGGEALPEHLANKLKELGCSITNLYGPTETTIWSTFMNIDEGEKGIPPIESQFAIQKCMYWMQGYNQFHLELLGNYILRGGTCKRIFRKTGVNS